MLAFGLGSTLCVPVIALRLPAKSDSSRPIESDHRATPGRRPVEPCRMGLVDAIRTIFPAQNKDQPVRATVPTFQPADLTEVEKKGAVADTENADETEHAAVSISPPDQSIVTSDTPESAPCKALGDFGYNAHCASADNTVSPPALAPRSCPELPVQAVRDPHRVLVVGASGRLGRAVVAALSRSKSPRYHVVAAVSSLSDAPQGAHRSLALDIVRQTPLLIETVRDLRLGTVVWCAAARRGEPARLVELDAVSNFLSALGGASASGGSVDANGWLARSSIDSEMIVDFGDPAQVGASRPVDDVVMGGMSSSRLIPGDPAVWTGHLTRARGGGFCTLRCANLPLSSPIPSARGQDLSGCTGVAVTVRGDGRRYKVNVKNSGAPEAVFQATFDTVDSTETGLWQTIRVPFSDFVPVRRGKLAYVDGGDKAGTEDGLDLNGASQVYSSQLDPSAVTSVGLVCSKVEAGGLPCPRFREGEFRLEVARIEGYRPSTPRYVHVSSAAVTRPFWDGAKKKLYKSSADIPIVNLNLQLGNLLGAKLAGENVVRSSGIPYVIVRPTGLGEKNMSGRAVRVSRGDFAVGRSSVADVARSIVTMLQSESATWKTLELNGDANEEKNEEDASAELVTAMSGLLNDDVQVLYPEVMDTIAAL